MSAKIGKALLAASFAALLGLASGSTALAAGMMHGGGHGHGMSIGEAGDPSKVSRTVEVVMKDNYFEPEEIEVKAGETVRFVIRNEGEFLHEFNIGTAAMHAEHQQEMQTMMEHGMITPHGIDRQKMMMDHGGGQGMMMHDDANSVLVEPGKSAELVWHFTEEAELEFACNVPGHYDAGMMGHMRFHHGS